MGQFRTRDVRAVLGGGFAMATHVNVLVLGLVCSRCAAPKLVLLTDGRGRLGCADCLKRRTRRQKERTLAVWRRGGQREDDLFRRLSGPQAQAPGTMTRAQQLVEEIVEGDLRQVSALAMGVHTALAMAALAEARR